MISASIAVFNEEKKLQKCLENIKGFVDEICVVDLDSSDESLKVAKNYGATVFSHAHVDYVELVRNFQIQHCKYEWILLLDPDEILTVQLKQKLKDISSREEIAAVNIPRKNIFFGQWIKHSNFWPDRQIRFFRKNKINWPEKIHTYPDVRGQIIDITADPDLSLQHSGYSTWGEFIKRQDRYSNVEVRNRRNSSLKKIFWSPLRTFLVRFIKHKGYLDGVNGVFIIFVLMFFSFVTELRVFLKK